MQLFLRQLADTIPKNALNESNLLDLFAHLCYNIIQRNQFCAEKEINKEVGL